jgi:DNA-binding CsgD family transcriptional regulator
LAVTELPDFIAMQYFSTKSLEPILADWHLPEGGLYFVTPTTRARPAKISALADYFIAKLMNAPWRAEAEARFIRDRESGHERAKLTKLKDLYALLTPRERQVLPLMISGLLNKQAAAELGISEVTLQIHRRSVMQKMKAPSVADLVRIAERLNIPAHK